MPLDIKDAEFAFVIAKQKDGRYAVGNVDDIGADRTPSVDDIFAAIKIVERDLISQQQVGMFVGALGQVMGQPPANGVGQQTKSGLVVPEPTSKFKKVTRVK